VPSGTLPRTSSGKLSRSQTKRDFIARQCWQNSNEVPQKLAEGNA